MTDSSAQALIEAATAARLNAYAPYSKFKVGAAVRGGSGRIHSGCNVESASFGLTCCAERTAVFKAVSEGETAITGVAVVTDMYPPASPCGACRQVLFEFGKAAPLFRANLDGEVLRTTVAELLPDGFDGKAVTDAQGR